MLAFALATLAACTDTAAESLLDRVAPAASPGAPATEPPAAEPPATGPGPVAASPTPAAIPADPGVVIRVVDGDTAHIRLASGTIEKVRFIGVNTPESTTRHEPYGKEASRFTTTRLDGRTVYLEYDVERRDRYGRLLAYIWMRPPSDGSPSDVRAHMFNATLLIEGYAQTATYPPNVRYADVFRDLQREAREQGRGLWALPSEDQGASRFPASSASSPRSGCDPS
ncbi:MAG TPA: thermonuclease family protein [Actinomycetota bacterium]|nr:thermonuclease family protein [Actinomycetota bacterium]